MHTSLYSFNLQCVADWYTVYGCIFDVMEMQCAANEIIFITEAVLGAYDTTCADDCCAPERDFDCLESISNNDPDTWRLIRADCTYKSSCLFQYQGNELLPCGVALADYMMISYTCTTGKISYSCTTCKISYTCTTGKISYTCTTGKISHSCTTWWSHTPVLQVSSLTAVLQVRSVAAALQ